MKHRTTLILVAAALALGACDKKPAPTTQPTSATPSADKPSGTSTIAPRNFTLGNAVGPNKKVSVATSTLTTKDAAHISVDLYGVGEAKVRTQWSQKGADGKGTPLKSDTETVNVTAPPVTVAFKAENLAPGSYDVELFVNEISAGKMPFTVK